VALVSKGNCQTSMPEVLNKKYPERKIDYIEEQSEYMKLQAIRETYSKKKSRKLQTDTIAEYK